MNNQQLLVIKAEEGFVFASKDKTRIFSSVIHLGIKDSKENYIEISVEEAEELRKQQKANQRNQHQPFNPSAYDDF